MRAALSQLQSGGPANLFINFRMRRSTLTKRRSRESPNCTAGRFKVPFLNVDKRNAIQVITLEINSFLRSCPLILVLLPASQRSRSAAVFACCPDSLVINTNEALHITDAQ